VDANEKENWILKLYNLGLTPIPIKRKSKLPNLEKGILEKIYRERPELDVIQKWIKENRFHNVGLVLGKVGGNLVCFDFDNKESSTVAKVNPYALINTGAWVQETPSEAGRYHIIMRDIKDNEVTRKTKHNVEYRSNLHYILIYPSINKEGIGYKLLNLDKTSIDSLILPTETDVDRHWDKIQELLSEHYIEDESLQDKVKNKKEFESSPDCIKNALNNGASKGERNSTILALASWMKQSGIPYDWGFDSIKEWVRTKCTSGKDFKLPEIVKSFDQGYKRDYIVGCTFWRENTKFCPFAEKKDCEYFRPDWHDKAELMEKYGVLKETKTGGTIVNCIGLAKLILNEHGYHFKTIIDEDTGKREVYYYRKEDGYYKNGGELIIRKLIQDYLDNFTTKHRKGETLSYIEDNDVSFRRELEPQPNLLNLKNGVYDLDRDILLPHSHDYGFINQLPINYDKDAKCPKIQNFFTEIFPGSYKDYIKVVQEMFGMTLYRDYFIHCAFILYGRGRNGKGVTVNLLCNMLGNKNFSTRQLHELLENRFAKADLYGRMANISAEISSRELEDTANFKALTGGEPVTAERKYLGSFNFINYATLIFNANRIPKTRDKSFAFYQRWKIIVFSQTFPRGEKRTIANLDKKLSTPEELSGLFNWALEGLKRTKTVFDFTNASHSTDEEELYELLSNPELTFIHSFLDVNTETRIPKDEVYGRYYSWCQRNRYPITTKNMFTKLLCETIPETEPRAFTTAEDKQGRMKTFPAYGNIEWIDSYVVPSIKKVDDRQKQEILEVEKDGKSR